MVEWRSKQPIKILVTGPKEQVGKALLNADDPHGVFEVIAAHSSAPNLRDPQVVAQVIEQSNPDFVVNTLGYNSVMVREEKVDLCYLLNRDFLAILAQVCREKDIPIIHLSSDHVFDGHYASGYTEDDEVKPLGIFGKSKWQGEELLRQKWHKSLILRVSWLFSPWGENFLTNSLLSARVNSSITAADDRWGCPTSASDIARVIFAIIRQLNDGASTWNTYHYCGAEVTTRFKFLEAICDKAKQHERLSIKELISVTRSELYADAERPASSVLNCKKLLNDFGIQQRPWRTELNNVMAALYALD